jgi:olefin beta-lactone synthetase
VRTQAFLLAQHRALAPSIRLEAGEVDLATLPVFVLANLAAGVTTVISAVDLKQPGAVDAAKIFAEARRWQVTRLTASPAFFECLLAHARRSGERLEELQKIYTGGAPVFPRLLGALRELAPQAEAVAVYGSTEAEPMAHATWSETEAALASGERGLLAGHCVTEVTVRVLRDRWGTVRATMSAEEFSREGCAIGEIGEIVVTGAHVLKGYLGGKGDEETKFRVGNDVWHRTGDAGYFDTEGRLWLQGRCMAKITDARGVIYPFAAECTAMRFTWVKRAALVGWNEKRVLVVEAEGSTERERELAETLAWAQVDEVRFWELLPVDKRHNAKVDYGALRAALEAGG